MAGKSSRQCPSGQAFLRGVAVALGIGAAVGVVGHLLQAWAAPTRYCVEGLSMAPGLMPGDEVVGRGWGMFAAWRNPTRGEVWLLRAPDGALAIKRVAGLPRELLRIVDGDLQAAGVPVVRSPAMVAPLVTVVSSPVQRPWGHRLAGEFPQPILDGAEFAPDERRWLEPVADGGVCAVVNLPGAAGKNGLVRVCLGIDGRSVEWSVPQLKRLAVVAGRLDGCFVASCWQVAGEAAAGTSAWPAGAPAAWSVREPWPRGQEPCARFSLQVDAAAGVTGSSAAAIEEFLFWRDVHQLPPESGTTTWQVGPNAFFMLGDFPAGSRDSRHWGPLGRESLLYPVGR